MKTKPLKKVLTEWRDAANPLQAGVEMYWRLRRLNEEREKGREFEDMLSWDVLDRILDGGE